MRVQDQGQQQQDGARVPCMSFSYSNIDISIQKNIHIESHSDFWMVYVIETGMQVKMNSDLFLKIAAVSSFHGELTQEKVLLITKEKYFQTSGNCCSVCFNFFRKLSNIFENEHIFNCFPLY